MFDHIILLLMLLKNASSLSMSVSHSKNGELNKTMKKITDPSNVSRLINQIDVAIAIANINLANPAMFCLIEQGYQVAAICGVD